MEWYSQILLPYLECGSCILKTKHVRHICVAHTEGYNKTSSIEKF